MSPTAQKSCLQIAFLNWNTLKKDKNSSLKTWRINWLSEFLSLFEKSTPDYSRSLLCVASVQLYTVCSSLWVMRGSSPTTETALPDLISKDWECHQTTSLPATCSVHRLSIWTHRILLSLWNPIGQSHTCKACQFLVWITQFEMCCCTHAGLQCSTLFMYH